MDQAEYFLRLNLLGPYSVVCCSVLPNSINCLALAKFKGLASMKNYLSISNMRYIYDKSPIRVSKNPCALNWFIRAEVLGMQLDLS